MEIRVPPLPESVSTATLLKWRKQEGETVARDELLVEIETDKVVMEVVALADGVVTAILKPDGEVVLGDEVIGTFDETASAETASAGAASPVPATPVPSADESAAASETPAMSGPAARKLADEMGIDIAEVKGSGRDGRITKEDVARVAAAKQSEAPVASALPDQATAPGSDNPLATGERVERRVPMTRLRASIAKRLVEAQRNAAMLTTFNEVDLTAVTALRRKFADEFQKVHNGTRLGLMSFFVRASVEALKRFPAVNASIDGNDVVYHGYFDIGVAVSTDRGLVVPIVRDADALSLAQIEDQIADFGVRARAGKLTIDEMQGGTFTISNGGVFGSLLSTPILNPPQTGILGMHKTQERPVVVDGQIVVRPMMYLALSYDHRLIDGREAVGFLVAIKNLLEDPARILLEL
jgi:2-oxoglutarate dehydrogenase E2 component (dihydrolipoamide succinyltransferase)